MVDIENSTTTASIGGISFRLDPERVSWGYKVKTNVTSTVGGKVVQIFGVVIDDLILFGSFGRGGFLAQLDFYNKMRALLDKQSSEEIPKPVRFIFPARGWDMNVYIKAISDPESDTSMQVRPNRINPQWQITLFVSDGGTKLKKVAMDDYLKRLAEGIGWEVSDFNGPGDETTAVGQIGESGLVTSGSTGSPASTPSTGGGTPTDPSIDGNIRKILDTIKAKESGADYNARNPHGANGAYQFVAGTWAGLNREMGGNASDWSPKHQDEVAAYHVTKILNANNNVVESVPASWYVGYYAPGQPAGNGRKWGWDEIPAPDQGNKLTIHEYVTAWMQTYNSK